MKKTVIESEFSVPIDFCCTAVWEAVDNMLPKKQDGNRIKIIKCASQNVTNVAIVAASMADTYFEIDFNYEPDEWSIETHEYSDGKLTIYRVHSDGA
jgi:hypothetical protein